MNIKQPNNLQTLFNILYMNHIDFLRNVGAKSKAIRGFIQMTKKLPHLTCTKDPSAV